MCFILIGRYCRQNLSGSNCKLHRFYHFILKDCSVTLVATNLIINKSPPLCGGLYAASKLSCFVVRSL